MVQPKTMCNTADKVRCVKQLKIYSKPRPKNTNSKIQLEVLNQPLKHVRNLGAWFDDHMSMNTHIGKVYSKAFRGLYNNRQIRKYLSAVSTKCLIHAFVTSHLDYCNSLLYKSRFRHQDLSDQFVGPTVPAREPYVYFDARFYADSKNLLQCNRFLGSRADTRKEAAVSVKML